VKKRVRKILPFAVALLVSPPFLAVLSFCSVIDAVFNSELCGRILRAMYGWTERMEKRRKRMTRQQAQMKNKPESGI
jgi:hypothetical protein